MRPDPWQREKSRRYQAKKKGRGEVVKTGGRKEGGDKNEKKAPPTAVDGGFKFVKPMPAPQAQYEDDDDDENEDEYDVQGLEDVGFDFSSLSIQCLNGPDVSHHCFHVLMSPKEYFSAEELKELDEAVDLEISGLEKMSKWLLDRLEGRSEGLLALEPILITNDRCVDARSPTAKPPVVLANVPRPRTDPLEDMLDDLLDT